VTGASDIDVSKFVVRDVARPNRSTSERDAAERSGSAIPLTA
jgi:hypothetical protein